MHFASPPGSPKTCTEASDRFILNELQKYISSRREKKITVLHSCIIMRELDIMASMLQKHTLPKEIDKPTLATDVGLTKPCPPDHPKVDLSCFAAEHHRINRCQVCQNECGHVRENHLSVELCELQGYCIANLLYANRRH